ncbi:MAG: hypothetical protein HeimC3_31760 [Candidatus Heimdallarchaeota archaeon LC_3]|nr:MAG: hypothetical protein HeimC3_31760 [Candidatus Heimdallarchaeota archaeon LC_3]
MQKLDYKTLIENNHYFIPHVIRLFTTTDLYNTRIDEKFYKEVLDQFFFYLQDLSVHPLCSEVVDLELLRLTKKIVLAKSPPYQIIDIIYETIALYDVVLFTNKYRVKGYRLFLILERSLVKSELKDFFSTNITPQEDIKQEEFLREHHIRYYAFFSKLVNQISESILYDQFPCPETKDLEEKFTKVYSELYQNIVKYIDLKIPQNIQDDDQLIKNYVRLKTRKLRNTIIFYSEIKHELIEYANLLFNSGESFVIKSEDIYQIVTLLDQQLADNYTQQLESPWKIGINIIKTLDIHAFLYLYNKIPIYRFLKLEDLNIQRNRQREKIVNQILKGKAFKELKDSSKQYSGEEINKLKKEYERKVRRIENAKKTTRPENSFLDKEISLIVKKLPSQIIKKSTTKKLVLPIPTSSTHLIDASQDHGPIIFSPYQLLTPSENDLLLEKLQSSEPKFDRIKLLLDYFLLTKKQELVIYSYKQELVKIIQSLLFSVDINCQISDYNKGHLLIISSEGFQRWKDFFGVPPILSEQLEKLLSTKK